MVAEQACKSYAISGNGDDMKAVLVSSLKDHLSRGGGKISIRALLDGSYVQQRYADLQKQFIFSADDILTDEVSTAEELEAKYRVALGKIHRRQRCRPSEYTILFVDG